MGKAADAAGLGAARDKTYPQGIAIRGYFESPISTDPWIESCLDVRDRAGAAMPGYGWIFPLGDGTINVGIGLLSTFKGYKDVNTSHLMTEWAATAPERWGIDPDAMLAPATGGRLPMAGSINPMLARHGDASEARQYSGRAVGGDWVCPFQGRAKRANDRVAENGRDAA